MEGSGRSPDDSKAFEHSTGEVLGDIRRPAARRVNSILKRLSGNSPHTVVLLGEDIGEVYTEDMRGARDDEEPGMLRVYLRKAGEHKLEVTVVAAGLVIGGLAALKYKKR